MNKIVRIGALQGRDVYCKITIKEKDGKQELSITGVHGPYRDGNSYGSCGQIIMDFKEYDHRGSYSIQDIDTSGSLFNLDSVKVLFDIWDKYHLNTMRAGTLKQEAFLSYHEKSGWKYNYKQACKKLKAAGLYDDNGRKYGHAWYYEPLPKSVVECLNALPAADKEPAWV